MEHLDFLWKPLAIGLGTVFSSFAIWIGKRYLDKIDSTLKAIKENLAAVNIKDAVQDEKIISITHRLSTLETEGKTVKYK